MPLTGKEIAEHLGISPATVSLALNDRPGVNPKTRTAVLTCRDMLLREKATAAKEAKKIILFNNEPFITQDFGLYQNSFVELFRVFNDHGYLLQAEVFERSPEKFEEQLEESISGNVAGIVVFAVNMPRGCMNHLRKVKIPMMIFDNNFRVKGADNLLIDNAEGIESAVELFLENGIREIYYLANADNGNFNFKERRAALKRRADELDNFKVHIEVIGKNIEEARRNAESFFMEHQGEQVAVLLENYQVALGVLGTAQRLGLRFPEGFFPVSFDELPESGLLTYEIPMIRVPHISKAKTAATRLLERIEGNAGEEITYTVRTTLLNGKSKEVHDDGNI